MYGIENKSHLGGYWKIKNPWGDPGTWCPEVWNNLIKKYNIKSVADIGCGLGFSSNYFYKKGLDVIGVEGGLNAIKESIFTGKIIHNDYTISSAFANNERFDLIWCCEFVEHVEEKYMYNFLSDFKHGKYIAMTFAIPGQEGYHHVNCQYQEYWIDIIQGLGFKFNCEYSKTLQEIAHKTNNDNNFPHGGHLTKLLFFEYE